jgi:hypothetical protein
VEQPEKPTIGKIYYLRWEHSREEMLLICVYDKRRGELLYEIIAYNSDLVWEPCPIRLVSFDWDFIEEYKGIDIKNLPLFIYFEKKCPKFSELLQGKD